MFSQLKSIYVIVLPLNRCPYEKSIKLKNHYIERFLTAINDYKKTFTCYIVVLHKITSSTNAYTVDLL